MAQPPPAGIQDTAEGGCATGAGCATCGGEGTIRLTSCPLETVPAEAFETVDLAGLLEKGLPPVAGGMLDQAKVFLDAARFVWNEEARAKAEGTRQ